MDQEERKGLKLKIENLIQKSESDIIELEELSQPIAPENSLGRISRMDAINNKSVTEAALRKKREKLAKLRHALLKIDDPDFGSCARCGNTIQSARLMFLPESSNCIHCAGK